MWPTVCFFFFFFFNDFMSLIDIGPVFWGCRLETIDLSAFSVIKILGIYLRLVETSWRHAREQVAEYFRGRGGNA
jgi:hypothetical protein